jgi:hypothetical protein
VAATAEDRKKLSYFLQNKFLAADVYNEAADYLQEAISSFVKSEDPVCDPSIDSTFHDFAGTLDTVTNNSQNKSCSFVNNISVPKCVYCTGLHSLENCEKFLLLSVEQRSTLAREIRVCFNCLRSGHFAPKCPSKSRCMHCRCMHHSLLHLVVSEIADVQATLTDVSHASDVLIATARINLHTAEGRCVKVRALLDQGSTLSFISKALCRTLRTIRQCANLQIRRFGKNYTSHARSKVVLRLSSCNKSEPMISLTAYVLPSITDYTSSQTQLFEMWPHLRDLELANPDPES